MDAAVDWHRFPIDLEPSSGQRKDEIVLHLISYMLYPPVAKRTSAKAEHNERARSRFLVFETARKLARLERRERDRGLSRQARARKMDLLNEFSEQGGFDALVRAPSKGYMEARKVAKCWEGWCTVFASMGAIHRAGLDAAREGRRTTFGELEARWLVLLLRLELPYGIASNKIQLSRYANDYAPVAHLIVAALRIVTPGKTPPTLRELRDRLSEQFERFIADIVALGRFFAETTVMQASSPIIAPEIQVQVKMEGEHYNNDRLSPGLSEQEKLISEHYTSERYRALTSKNAPRALKDIMAGTFAD